VNDSELHQAVADAIRAAREETEALDIRPESRLVEDLSLDSLDLMSTMMNLQDAHQIELDLDVVIAMKTVSDLRDELGRQLRAKSAAA